MKSNEKFWHDYVLVFLKGLFMGAADIIPGVSGGTIAFITGIYTRLIDAIAYIADFLKPVNLKKEFNFKFLKKKILGIDFKFFIPLCLGIITSFLLLSNVIHYLLEQQAAFTYAFFFGLIIASALFLYRKLHSFDLTTALSLLAGIFVGIALVGMNQFNVSHSLPVLFMSGAVAITAMILPGISGAFILLLLNQYEYVLEIIGNFMIVPIVVFVMGAATGLLLFSEVLRFLLHKKREVTMGFLIGLMLGSLRLPVTIISDSGFDQIGKLILLTIVGFVLVYLIELTADNNN